MAASFYEMQTLNTMQEHHRIASTIGHCRPCKRAAAIIVTFWMAACGGTQGSSSTLPSSAANSSTSQSAGGATASAAKGATCEEKATATNDAGDASISGPGVDLQDGIVNETPRLFKLIVTLPFEEVEMTVLAEIGRQNFNPLQPLDVQRGLHNRGVEFPAFRVYQFCALQHALALFKDNKDFGAFIPCSILLYEEGDKTVIVARKFAADLIRIQGYTPAPEALEAAEKIDSQVRQILEAVVEEAQQ